MGLPSRLTAEPQERGERAHAVARALGQGASTGYGGTRVDAEGRLLRIEGAKLWSLQDEEGREHGQAACFSNWWWI